MMGSQEADGSVWQLHQYFLLDECRMTRPTRSGAPFLKRVRVKGRRGGYDGRLAEEA